MNRGKPKRTSVSTLLLSTPLLSTPSPCSSCSCSSCCSCSYCSSSAPLLSACSPLTPAGILILITYLLTCILLGLRLRHDLEAGSGTGQHALAMHISALFTFMSIPISLYQIYDHLAHFFQPKLQIQVIRIILIVPIFALESSLSIHFIDYSFYFQVVREFYESYVIYSFMRFLLYYLGDTEKIVESLSTKSSSFGVHSQPFCCLSTWTMGRPFLIGCKAGVLQYVINRFVLTTLSLILHVLGMYVEGDYSLDSPYLYLTLINSLSQTYALYALFLFYYASSAEFKSIRPFEKFLSIKLIIFFSWWQGILIGFLVSGSQLDLNESFLSSRNSTLSSMEGSEVLSRKINSGLSADQHATQHMADGIQDLLICMEMLIAAVAFTYSFPVADFIIKDEASISVVNESFDEAKGIFDSIAIRESPGMMPAGYAPSQTRSVSGMRRRGGNGFNEGSSVNTPSSSSRAVLDVESATSIGVNEIVEKENEEEDVTVQRMMMLVAPPVEKNCPVADDSTESLLEHGSDIRDLDDGQSSTSSSSSRKDLRNKGTGRGNCLPKSNSTGSLCSSDSNGSHVPYHSKYMALKPANDFKRGSRAHVSRKFNWKESSTHSLYSHSNLHKKNSMNDGLVESSTTSSRFGCLSCCSTFVSGLLAFLDTTLVGLSSLLYYLSSFFLKSEMDSHPYRDKSTSAATGDLRSPGLNKYHRHTLGDISSKRTTPQQYYDYHYYHAPSVQQQLQHSGKFTVLQAIYLTLSMGDLKDDMVEMLTLAIDSFIIIPSLQLKRWIKSNSQ